MTLAALQAAIVLVCAATATGQVAVSRTPQQLADAIRNETPHILIAEHLDLRNLQTQNAAGGEAVLFVVPPAVKSITANCTGPPPASLEVDAFAPPQCVLQVASSALRFTAVNSTVWLHALHLYAVRPQGQPGNAEVTLLSFNGIRSRAWITSTTFQGTGGLVRGVVAEATRTYVGGSNFRGLREETGPAFLMSDDEVFATAVFESTRFENITSTGTRPRGCSEVPSGVVTLLVGNECRIRGGMTFRNCTFRNNVGMDVDHNTDDIFSDTPLDVVSDDSEEDCGENAAEDVGMGDYEMAETGYDDYSSFCGQQALDDAIASWRRTPDEERCADFLEDLYDADDFPCDQSARAAQDPPANSSQPLRDVGRPGSPWSPDAYLSATSPELQRIQQARDAALQSDPAAQAALAAAPSARDETQGSETGATGDDEDDDSNVGAIVGGVLGALAFVVLAAVACALIAMRRRRHKHGGTPLAAEDDSPSKSLRAYTMPMPDQAPSGIESSSLRTAGAMGASTKRTSSASGNGSRDSMLRSLMADSTQDSRHHSSARPDSHTPAHSSDRQTDLERVQDASVATAADAEELEGVLDVLHEERERFAGRFWAHNHFFRRTGGQGIVQFMQRCQDGGEMAVKFFLAPGAFERELEYYQDAKLREILVPVVHFDSNQSGAVRSRSGYVFPPFIVVERGESLNEWVSRVAADTPTTIFVLLHLAEKLEKLHANGLCHRDLKPANVLWRPTENAWTLMDFGCAASTGSPARLAYSVHYAAPEVILADEANAREMVVQPSLDMWSLGIIAVELLTSARVFAPPVTESEARDQLAGRAPLPWEDPARQQTIHAQLKVLRRSVLKCLDRDPAQRPTSRELLGSWNGLFESLTGTTTANYVVPEKGSAR